MVKLVRKELVNEAKQVGNLYHVCTLDAFVNYIIPDNELRASGKYWNELLNTNQQVCFSRDPLFVVPTDTVSFASNNILFQFVVDGDKLSDKYKITPFNYASKSKTHVNNNQKYREKEEDIIGPIKNFKSYVKEVRFDIKDLSIDKYNILRLINKLEEVDKYLGSIACKRVELPYLNKSTWDINFGKVKNPTYNIKTLDDFIALLKEYSDKDDYKLDVLNIDTPDLFVKHFYSLSDKEIDYVLENHPKWIKYIDIVDACNKGSLKLVKILIKNGVDVNYKPDKFGPSSLELAFARKNLDLIKLLVDNGANVNGKYGGDPYLFLVCLPEKGLGLKLSINERSNLLSLFIEHGANVNVKNKDGDPLLLLVCGNNNNLELVRLLLKNGADPNIKNKFGDTSLLLSCSHDNNKDIVELLLKNGADPNIQNDNGNAPLHYAYNKDIVELLLKNGADPNIKNKYDKTAIYYASKRDFGDSENIIELLKKYGATE